MKSPLKTVGVVSAVAGLVIVVAGCSSSSSPPTTGGGGSAFSDASQGVSATSVDYGLIYDQTGPTAGTQVPFGDGILAAIKKVNDAGGINGRKINPVVCDEKYQVAAAVACLKGMIDQTPVVGLSGLNNSGFQAAGLPLVQAAKIPVIGPESTSKGIVSPFPQYVWATECTYPNQADVAVAFAAKKLGKTQFTAVGLGGNVASADAYLNQIKERVQKLGATYSKTVHYEYGTPNMDQQAQEIATIKPDVIFTHGGNAQNVTAFKSLEKFGVTNTLVIGIFAQETDAIAQASPKVGANYYAMNCYSNARQTDVPGTKDLIVAAKAAGYPANVYESTDFTNGYVNGLLIAEGIKKAGDKLTRQSLNAAMATITNFDTQGLSPNISFSATNSVGVTSVRPYKFNYSTSVWEPEGSYEQYAQCNSHEFEKGNIDGWSADCIK